jgi:hypothetical protein
VWETTRLKVRPHGKDQGWASAGGSIEETKEGCVLDRNDDVSYLLVVAVLSPSKGVGYSSSRKAAARMSRYCLLSASRLAEAVTYAESMVESVDEGKFCGTVCTPDGWTSLEMRWKLPKFVYRRLACA